MARLRITFEDFDAAVEEALWLREKDSRTYCILQEKNGAYWVQCQQRAKALPTPILWTTTMRNELPVAPRLHA